jgi:hypothetical protein
MKKLAVYLVLFFGLPTVASSVKHNVISTICGIVWIFLVIPWGILMAIEYYRTNDGTRVRSRVFNVLFRVPLALFGALCIGAGVSIIGWVLYNVIFERQKEYTGPKFITGWGSFGVSVPLILFGWMLLRSVVRRKESVVFTPEEEEEFEHEEDNEEHAEQPSESTRSPMTPPQRKP